jgi:hypothetical protein
MPDVELKAVPKLSTAQLEQINEAIVDAFDAGELIRVLRFKWGLVLGNYINLKQGFYGIVGDLIDWTERRRKTLARLHAEGGYGEFHFVARRSVI